MPLANPVTMEIKTRDQTISGLLLLLRMRVISDPVKVNHLAVVAREEGWTGLGLSAGKDCRVIRAADYRARH
jgi:hypothetical protein